MSLQVARIVALVVAVVVHGLFTKAEAHPSLQNAMWLVFGPDRIQAAVNVSIREIAVAQALKPDAQGNFPDQEVSAATERHAAYLLSHLSLTSGGEPLTGKVTRITPPVLYGPEPDQTFYQYELEYSLPAATPPPSAVTIRHSMLAEWPYGPGQAWDVTYAVRMKRHDHDEVRTALLRAGEPLELPTGFPRAPEAKSPAEPPPLPSPFAAYFRHGLIHILEGWDHLLFVTALVLAASTFWELVKVIAAFTLAHSITLAVSVLTGFQLPSIFVEPVIAGSIVVVALGNLLWPGQRGAGWRRLITAFAFGLVHGLGFAGGLRESMGELGTTAIVTALIAFSLGVEVGHQSVVLPTFAVLKLGQARLSTAFRTHTIRYGSLVLALAGGYYLFHALAGEQ